MNNNITIREDQWSKIVSFLHTQPGVYAGQETSLRRFLEGVLWILWSGAQWRLLPEAYGNWNSVYKRFARWCEQGIWQALHQHFAKDPDMEHIILDSTIVRAHSCAAGARKKNGGQAAQALGRGRGGFSTKIHVNVDALGNPLRFRLTAGQRHDITQAEALIAEYEFERLIADGSYDADAFLHLLADKDVEAVIPPRKNRKEMREYDRHLYKERHLWSVSLISSNSIAASFPALTNWLSVTWAFCVWLGRSHLVTLKCQHNLTKLSSCPTKTSSIEIWLLVFVVDFLEVDQFSISTLATFKSKDVGLFSLIFNRFWVRVLK